MAINNAAHERAIRNFSDYSNWLADLALLLCLHDKREVSLDQAGRNTLLLKPSSIYLTGLGSVAGAHLLLNGEDSGQIATTSGLPETDGLGEIVCTFPGYQPVGFGPEIFSRGLVVDTPYVGYNSVSNLAVLAKIRMQQVADPAQSNLAEGSQPDSWPDAL